MEIVGHRANAGNSGNRGGAAGGTDHTARSTRRRRRIGDIHIGVKRIQCSAEHPERTADIAAVAIDRALYKQVRCGCTCRIASQCTHIASASHRDAGQIDVLQGRILGIAKQTDTGGAAAVDGQVADCVILAIERTREFRTTGADRCKA